MIIKLLKGDGAPFMTRMMMIELNKSYRLLKKPDDGPLQALFRECRGNQCRGNQCSHPKFYLALAQ